MSEIVGYKCKLYDNGGCLYLNGKDDAPLTRPAPNSKYWYMKGGFSDIYKAVPKDDPSDDDEDDEDDDGNGNDPSTAIPVSESSDSD